MNSYVMSMCVWVVVLTTGCGAIFQGSRQNIPVLT